jgi:hypothetical protein
VPLPRLEPPPLAPEPPPLPLELPPLPLERPLPPPELPLPPLELPPSHPESPLLPASALHPSTVSLSEEQPIRARKPTRRDQERTDRWICHRFNPSNLPALAFRVRFMS